MIVLLTESRVSLVFHRNMKGMCARCYILSLKRKVITNEYRPEL